MMETATLPRALADLHRHLDGSLRPDTVNELAAGLGLTVPEDLPFSPGMGLQAALSRFRFTCALLQEPDAVRRVASEICEDAATEGVSTLEIRFAPQLHRAGATDEVIDAALDGIGGRAGLLLCALYGESPEAVENLVVLGASKAGVVGIDLAGGPAPEHRWSLEDYGPAFQRAARAGLGRTVHAGEGRPAEEIRTAVEVLGAQRIGHGTSLCEDLEVLALVIERDIVVEACPTSNVHTGIIERVADHPLKRWLDAGVRVCVCTDNTLLSAVDAPTELDRVRAIEGLTEADIATLVDHGHRGAFPRTGS